MEDNQAQNDIVQSSPPQDGDVQSPPVQDYHDESSDTSVSSQPIVQPSVANVNENPQPNVSPDVTPITPELLKPVTSSPGLIVLQWLTYAFWGWTVVAMSFLTVTVLAHFINGADVGDSTLYSIAAVLVLLPISVVCDIFYIKREPEKKTGASSIVMVIHAVIFALCGIGALVTVVFSLVTLYISSSGSENTMVALYSALIIAFLFAVIFLRTILPKKLFRMRRYFIILMVLVVGIIITFGAIGPVAEARATRTDKLIESGLDGVQYGVDNYVSDNKKLPNSLADIKLTGDTKKLVTDNLVTYKNDGKSSGYINITDSTDPTDLTDTPTEDIYRYQLCVTYKKATDGYSNRYDSSDVDSDGYGTYLSNYSHPAGAICYKLKTVTTD